MNTREQPGRDAPPLAALRVSGDADAGQVADAMAASWQAIHAALSPILGARGVAALYQRSLFLTCTAHRWLASLQDGVDGRIEFAALKAAFAQQTSIDARNAGNALMQAFHELLTSLVGVSLTERLLHSVWTDPSTSPPQDTSP